MIFCTGSESEVGKKLLKSFKYFELPYKKINRNLDGLELSNNDFLIHLSSATPYNSSNSSSSYIYDNNMYMVESIISKGAQNAKMVIFASSINACEINNLQENTTLYKYALSKINSEDLMIDAGLKLISLRMPLILTKKGDGLLHRFRKKLLINEKVKFSNTFNNFNHFIDIKSINNFVLFLIRNHRKYVNPNYILNIASDPQFSLLEVIQFMSTIYSSKSILESSQINKKYVPIDNQMAIENGFVPPKQKFILKEWLK